MGVVAVTTDRAQAGQFLPLLSRGRHRRPRKGACVMEYASFLAGEKWSDHPSCTHPLLAELARQVNDFISDRSRQTLVEFVPDLIGLTGAGLQFDVRIALHVARIALPVVAEERQHMMATAILTCERLLADLDGRPGTPLTSESCAALDRAPAAAAWARRFTRRTSISRRAFRREAGPAIVRYGVQGVAHACVLDPDALLRDMLVGAIAECQDLRRLESPPSDQRSSSASATMIPAGPRT
jgi:hypothetical protein